MKGGGNEGWDLDSSDRQVWVVTWGLVPLVHPPARMKEAKQGPVPSPGTMEGDGAVEGV